MNSNPAHTHSVAPPPSDVQAAVAMSTLEPAAMPSSAQQVREMVTASWTSQAVYLAAKIGIPDILAGGPIGAHEIASLTGNNPDAVFRLMRALASNGIFAEVGPQRFQNTELSEVLRSDVPNSVRHLTMWYGEEIYRAWTESLYSIRTGAPAFDRVFGIDVWEYLSRNRQAAINFGVGMTAKHWSDYRPLVNAYDFSRIRCLVDVGGGQGTMLAAILNDYPDMRGVLVDLPTAVADARTLLTGAGVADRCEVVVGSGFESLPKGDGYLLSSVLHLMNNTQVRAILDQIRLATSPGGRVLIVERVLPPGDKPHFGKLLDLIMLLVTGGRERTLEEFTALYEDSGFQVGQVVPLPFSIAGIGLSLVEGLERHGHIR